MDKKSREQRKAEREAKGDKENKPMAKESRPKRKAGREAKQAAKI